MQVQIKEMATKLDEFARELTEYNGTGGQTPTIDFKQIKAVGSRNPIVGHILEKADADVKKKYITMLIAIAYLAQEKQENAWLLIQRITTGANFNEELMDIRVDAVNLTDIQIDAFTVAIANAKLTNAFVLDALLIYLSCETENEKILEFLSALFELVKCSKQELQELSELAKIIANQDSNAYSEYCFREHSIDITDSFGYVKLFHEGILCCNSKNFIVFYPEKKKISPEILSKICEGVNSNKIVLQNIIFSNIDKEFKFVKCSSIEINNCDFYEWKYRSFQAEESGKIVITNCKFYSMNGRALYFSECKNINIDKCIFEKCLYKRNGGVIYANTVETLNVENSSFLSCSTTGGSWSTVEIIHFEGSLPSSFGSVAYLCNVHESKWCKNQFENCIAYGGYLIYQEKPQKISAVDCTYSNCSQILNEIRSGFKEV